MARLDTPTTPKICAMPGSCLNPKTRPHRIAGQQRCSGCIRQLGLLEPDWIRAAQQRTTAKLSLCWQRPKLGIVPSINQVSQLLGNLVLDRRRPVPAAARCPSKPSRPSNLHPTESCCPRTAYGRYFERSVRCVEFVGQLTAPDVLARFCLLLIHCSDPRERAMEPIRLVDCSVSTAPFLCYTFASGLPTDRSCTWRIPVSEVSYGLSTLTGTLGPQALLPLSCRRHARSLLDVRLGCTGPCRP